MAKPQRQVQPAATTTRVTPDGAQQCWRSHKAAARGKSVL